ncbi:MAG: D-glycero-beta-D-manno-heptose 1,7-bisphosphate 7-phosphatase [Candidatus Promineifilaceae bacterium]|jgi:D-glycero-D-manno-heptose 1,7-bisphosphate phosphatase
MSKAIFLDRDGVIIENRSNYVRSWADVVFISGALEALERLAEMPYKIVLVTNQSAVGRGIITLAEAEAINKKFLEVIEAAGGRIDGLYMCPHAPQDGCQCRKPLPGLLLNAAGDLDIDLKKSLMVGDALTDLQAGRGAGVPDNYLVLTGRGMDQLNLPGAEALRPFTVIQSLANLPAVVMELCK